MKTLLRAWQPQDNRLVKFGLLLALSGIGWILCSAALITGFAPAPINGPADFIRLVVLSDDSLLFPGWLALGALLAAPMFASSVVTIPILLDRRISVMAAVLTSWRVVMAHANSQLPSMSRPRVSRSFVLAYLGASKISH